MTNQRNTVFYVGVTSNLVKRSWQHKNKAVEGFTQKYNLEKLVWYEQLESIEEAIKQEKYLKGKNRSFKWNLIKSQNPKLEDLYSKLT